MHGSDAGQRQIPLDGGQRRGFSPADEEAGPIKALSPAWRQAAHAATIGIFVILFFVALSLARPVLLPVVTAFVVTMTVGPLSARADRLHIPAPLSAIVFGCWSPRSFTG